MPDKQVADSSKFSELIDVELIAQYERDLKKYFGFSKLRPCQAATLSTLSRKQDCLTIMPTGGGKSLCYLMPALSGMGLVLVVSPLIALIRDQVRKYRKMGIACAAFDSMQSTEERSDVWTELERGKIRLLYLSPERLAIDSFREKLSRIAAVSLVAVDEAHCISQWGGHFRPEYRKLGSYLDSFAGVQKLALTATVTQKVKSDIVASLGLENPTVVVDRYLRDNLKIRVVKCKSYADQMNDILQSVLSSKGQGIVYAPTRKKVDEIYSALQRAKVTCQRYHAGMRHDGRNKAQQDFLSGKTQVMIATNAFGMGIDKADIRFVFHAGMPSSLENYMQEIGRAGRDGKDAKCYLFFTGRDYHLQKFIVDKSFPDTSLLKKSYTEIERLVEDYSVRNEAEIFENLQQKFWGEDFDATSIMRMFYKEGFIIKSESLAVDWSMGVMSSQVSLSQNKDAMDEFWDQYPSRKEEQMQKLRHIRDYVNAGENRYEVIERYFDV